VASAATLATWPPSIASPRSLTSAVSGECGVLPTTCSLGSCAESGHESSRLPRVFLHGAAIFLSDVKRATRRELIVVAAMIPRMIVTSPFSDPTPLSVRTARSTLFATPQMSVGFWRPVICMRLYSLQPRFCKTLVATMRLQSEENYLAEVSIWSKVVRLTHDRERIDGELPDKE
jgi:hypothetical protein